MEKTGRGGHNFEVRGGGFDSLTAEQAREARRKLEIFYPTKPIFQQDANVEVIAKFMQRDYDPKQVHTRGAYALALKELKGLGVIVPQYSSLGFQELEDLYYQIEKRVKAELERRGKLRALEEEK